MDHATAVVLDGIHRENCESSCCSFHAQGCWHTQTTEKEMRADWNSSEAFGLFGTIGRENMHFNKGSVVSGLSFIL
jgi:hypothetical protein